MIPQKFKDILPKDCQIVFNDNNIEIIKHGESIANIYVSTEEIFEICSLFVNEEYRLKGIGTFLIILIAEIYKDSYEHIHVDNHTDRKYNSIYSFAFKHKDQEYPDEEMIANVQTVINEWKPFITKYLKRKNAFFIC